MPAWRPKHTLLAAGMMVGLSCAVLSPTVNASGTVLQVAEEKKPEPGAAEPEEEVRPATEAEKKAAVGAIEAQLKAFREDDWVKATKFQCLELRKNFETPEDFRRAIKTGYPQFANYKTAAFGAALCDTKGEKVQVSVTLTGQDGVVVRAIYLMIKEEGEYRVGGVFGGAKTAPKPRDIT